MASFLERATRSFVERGGGGSENHEFFYFEQTRPKKTKAHPKVGRRPAGEVCGCALQREEKRENLLI